MTSHLLNQHFIAGKFIPGKSSDNLKVLDKYNGGCLAEIVLCDKRQMDQAIEASLEGCKKLSKLSAGERSELLSKLSLGLKARSEEFAQLICAEAGKPISYARAEVERAMGTLKFSAEEALRFGGEMIPMDFGRGTGRTAYTKHFPVGPIACLSPFNFPLNLAMHKIAPALAVGCSIVLKPSPFAPLSALLFAKLCAEVGLPDGALNIVVCNVPEAQALASDGRMKMLSFTGSAKVGWQLKNLAGKKKVTLELGGNAAVIVDESADLKKAAKAIANGAYLYAGQICISTQRIFVLNSVYERFLPLLIEEIKALKCGDPRDEKVTVGPMIAREHVERVESWVQEAKKRGAKILCGGEVVDREHSLYAPTLMSQVAEAEKLSCEEVFGPVAVISSVASFEAALEKVNASNYGLQAGVFTNRLDRMKEAHQTLEVGAVIVNDVPGFRVDQMPYGGVKDSGLGREGVRYAMQEMTEPRLLVY